MPNFRLVCNVSPVTAIMNKARDTIRLQPTRYQISATGLKLKQSKIKYPIATGQAYEFNETNGLTECMMQHIRNAQNDDNDDDIQGGSKKVSCWHSTTAYFFEPPCS